MAKLVLEKLGSLYHIAAEVFGLRKVDLNLATAPTAVWIGLHMRVELHDGVLVGLRTDVEHHAQLWLQVLADTLEEPLV